MSRSLKKGPYIDNRLMQKVAKAKASGSHQAIKTWSRSSTIVPEMVGFKFAVHNGRNFIEVLIDENKVGHKLGEFSATRKFVRHGGKMQKEQELAAAAAAGQPAAAPVAAAAPAAAKPSKK